MAELRFKANTIHIHFHESPNVGQNWPDFVRLYNPDTEGEAIRPRQDDGAATELADGNGAGSTASHLTHDQIAPVAGTRTYHPVSSKMEQIPPNAIDVVGPLIQPPQPVAQPASPASIASARSHDEPAFGFGRPTRFPAANAERPERLQTLRRLMVGYYRRQSANKSTATWQQYLTILRKWESHHDGRGPDLRQLTAPQIEAFFRAERAWQSRQSWVRNRTQFFALLKACCRQTVSNPSGLAMGWLFHSVDELPIWEVPPARWFRDRAREQARMPAPPTNGRHGGHMPFDGDLLTFAELQRVLRACDLVKDPLWWRTLIAWVMTYASRRGDFLTIEWSAIDFEQRQFKLRETKGGGLIVAPLAIRFLEPLHQLQRDNPVGPWHRKPNHLDRWFYPTWNNIWELAGVPRRTPHQLRDECSNWWNEHDRNWGDLITGHATTNTRDLHYDRCRRGRISPAFRQAVATFPTIVQPNGSRSAFDWSQ